MPKIRYLVHFLIDENWATFSLSTVAVDKIYRGLGL